MAGITAEGARPTEEAPRRIPNYLKWLAISMVLMLVSAIGASLTQTGAGQVRVDDFLLPMPNGEQLSVTVMRPASATKDNPAPAVITTHGYFNSKGMQDATAVELSRRGVVVYAFDLYHHGQSSGTRETYLRNREFYGLGMMDLVEYVATQVEYVDSERIGITGHSTGGRAVSYALDAYGRNYRIEHGGEQTNYAGEPADAGKYQTRVKSALIVANVPAPYLLESIPPNIDVGILMGLYDEGAPMQMTKIDGYFWSDMSISPEIKNFINLTHPDTFQLDREVTIPESGKPSIKFSNWDNDELVQIGEFYGTPGSGDARIAYNPAEIHPWNHFSRATTADIVNFFTATLNVGTDLDSGNQVWWLKELFNAIGLVGFLVLVQQLVRTLLQLPAFASIRRPVVAAAQMDSVGKRWYLGGLIATAVFAGASVMPLMQLNTKIFTNSATQNTNVWFDQPSTNQVMIWAIGNAIFGLLLMLAARKWGRLNISLRGAISERPGNLVKIIVLVVLTIALAYSVVAMIKWSMNTDFRLWTAAIQTPSSQQVVSALKYAPFFLTFFLVNALAVNVSLRTNQAKWKNLAAVIAGVVAGLVAVIAIQYAVLFARGEALWHPNLSWINVLLLIPLVPYLSVAVYYARTLYEETGSVLLPALLNAGLLTLITTANTTSISVLG